MPPPWIQNHKQPRNGLLRPMLQRVAIVPSYSVRPWTARRLRYFRLSLACRWVPLLGPAVKQNDGFFKVTCQGTSRKVCTLYPQPITIRPVPIACRCSASPVMPGVFQVREFRSGPSYDRHHLQYGMGPSRASVNLSFGVLNLPSIDPDGFPLVPGVLPQPHTPCSHKRQDYSQALVQTYVSGSIVRETVNHGITFQSFSALLVS
ncbi:hypothetical protein CCUS01_16365 [Colletotrichum cuscutae]|uniref:Uncharacterized protein n=1 Tax=Colletotrichum cuscutae TaxID=1209917 RepID=A0AAI9V9R3_9PEZI|nr:hypothetical protein CCUS01_16365 [Colletotrichum cuscutae]